MRFSHAIDNVFLDESALSSNREALAECQVQRHLAVGVEPICYIRDYDSPKATRQGLEGYFEFSNQERPHQALGYRTPAEVCVNPNHRKPRAVETTSVWTSGW